MAEFRLPLSYTEKVGRSVHNFNTVKRFTLHPMLLYPAYARRMKRGEKFIFSTPQLLLQSQPTFAPVMGTYRLRVEWYFNSDANHYGWIDNNSRLTPTELLQRRHHTMTPDLQDAVHLTDNRQELFIDPMSEGVISPDPSSLTRYIVDKYGVGRGSIADYMGVAPGYIPSEGTYAPGYNDAFGNVWNLDFILTYLNIIRCYHTNQQFPDVPYVSNFPDNSMTSYNEEQAFDTYSQSRLDALFMFLRYCDNGINFDALNSAISFEDIPRKYVDAVDFFLNYLKSVTRPNGGLFCCQYQPDLYRNLLPNDQNLLKSEVKVNDDGSFSIETFRFQNRLQLIYDRINPFGGKDSSVSRTRWGVKSNRDYDIPELVCVNTEFIDTSAITSNNSGTAERYGETIENVPGDLSGNVNQRKFPKGKQSFTANVPGTLMAIVSLVPLVDYSQNIDRYLLQNNFEDEFSPQMARRGFEDVPLSDYLALPLVMSDIYPSDNLLSGFRIASDYETIVGKQVAWLHDMTSVNRVHGEFSNYGYYQTWVLGRNYLSKNVEYHGDEILSHPEPNISPYGNPLDWQYPFISQNLSDTNWYCQVMFDVRSISPVGYRFMPTLE